jgi:hypothetical protein
MFISRRKKRFMRSRSASNSSHLQRGQGRGEHMGAVVSTCMQAVASRRGEGSAESIPRVGRRRRVRAQSREQERAFAWLHGG